MKYWAKKIFNQHPKTFFLSFIFGLIVCSILGRWISTRDYYEDFVRLGGAHATRGLSNQPTALQLMALVENLCPKDRILVLVGGSSVFFGSGQPTRYLWSKQLQINLGDKYCVINFAAPAGGLVGYASVIFEAVQGKYADTFLVTDASQFPSPSADGMIWYKHIFWDAYYKGLLSEDVAHYPPHKIKNIIDLESSLIVTDAERSQQIRLGMFLDQFFYFNELWSYVHYKYFQTIYDPLMAHFNWGPLRVITDYDYEFDEKKVRSLTQYPEVNSPTFLSEIAIVRSYFAGYFESKEPNFLNSSLLVKGADAIKLNPLNAYANKIIIVSVPESPYYTEKMDSLEQAKYREVRMRILEEWKKQGFLGFYASNLGAEDYGDRSHLNTLGGNKIAKEVAKIISAQSHKL